MHGYRLDFCAKLLLDAIQIESILIGNQIDCKSQMSISARPADSVKVCFTILGEVKVDDDVNSLDINTARQKIYEIGLRSCSIGTAIIHTRANEVAAYPVTEVMKYTVTMRLKHLRMRVETRVAEFGHLLCKKFYTIS